jgi:hypothetical protein
MELCPVEHPPQKYSTAQYSTVFDNVITVAVNPINGAGDHSEMCARYKYAMFNSVSITFRKATFIAHD